VEPIGDPVSALVLEHWWKVTVNESAWATELCTRFNRSYRRTRAYFSVPASLSTPVIGIGTRVDLNGPTGIAASLCSVKADAWTFIHWMKAARSAHDGR